MDLSVQCNANMTDLPRAGENAVSACAQCRTKEDRAGATSSGTGREGAPGQPGVAVDGVHARRGPRPGRLYSRDA